MKGKIDKIKSDYKQKKYSPSELCDYYLKKVRSDKCNAYITVTADFAAEQLKNNDKSGYNEIDYPLFAIPFAVKDNISTRGILTTCASKMLSDYVPIYDAFAYSRILNGGAIMLGKTNMDEFAMGSSGESSYYGCVKNPIDENYVSGGSSSGSACAVANGSAVFTLGSDTGGSVRQPASFCGCVGFKPSYSSVSRFGLISYASSFDQIGIFSSSVADSAKVFDVISAYDKMDDTCKKYKRVKTESRLGTDIKGIKIGLWKNLFDSALSDMNACYEKCFSALSKIGAITETFSFENTKYIIPVYYILASAQAASNLSRYDGLRYGYRPNKYSSFNDMIKKSRTEGFGNEVKKRIMLGNYVLSEGFYDRYYKKAFSMKEYLAEWINKLFEKYDFIVTPTVCTHPYKIGESEANKEKTYYNDICTVTANLCELPAISIPCGYDSNLMPIGLQIIGKKFDDAGVLNAAYMLEDYFYQNGIVTHNNGGENHD